MSTQLIIDANTNLDLIREQGLYKSEREITSPQSSVVAAQTGNDIKNYINFCANNYLGLADNADLIEAAKEGIDSHGFGMASVRFICGTQDIHKQLEARLAAFLGVDDVILFSSCFDANAGIFEALLGEEDAVISDALNHASIIDGIRLCKARRLKYANSDMVELEACLQQAQDARYRLIVTDGVFSMDGVIANLPDVCDLAQKYDALVMVDDSHAIGIMGERGAGTPEFCNTEGRVQILSGTFGKALGGASGGYIAGPGSIVELLRQKARPYLFSNSVAPGIVNATLKALTLVEEGTALRKQLRKNSEYFRKALAEAGFSLAGSDHPIIPVMIGDAKKAQQLATLLWDQGIFVAAFSYPVVPKGAARIRTQMSSGHSHNQLQQAIDGFIAAGKKLEII